MKGRREGEGRKGKSKVEKGGKKGGRKKRVKKKGGKEGRKEKRKEGGDEKKGRRKKGGKKKKNRGKERRKREKEVQSKKGRLTSSLFSNPLKGKSSSLSAFKNVFIWLTDTDISDVGFSSASSVNPNNPSLLMDIPLITGGSVFTISSVLAGSVFIWVSSSSVFMSIASGFSDSSAGSVASESSVASGLLSMDSKNNSTKCYSLADHNDIDDDGDDDINVNDENHRHHHYRHHQHYH